MSAARFRFCAELRDFLPDENRGEDLTRGFSVSGARMNEYGLPVWFRQ